MNDQTIRCPQCQASIPLTQTLSHQLKEELEAVVRIEQEKKEAVLRKQEQELSALKDKIEKKELSLDNEVEIKLKAEKEKMWLLAQQKALEKNNLELQDLKRQNEEREIKLREAEQKELAFRAQARELEERERRQQIDFERRIDEERKLIEDRTRLIQQEQLDERLRLQQEDHRRKELEKDKQIEMMRRSLDEAQRKASQSSTQIQGEVQEADLKQMLAAQFQFDHIDDVPQGVNGADLIQSVRTPFGEHCGVILWESKNTKTWSTDWIKKLKGDQGIAKADVCVLVSKVMPEGVIHFGSVDGVWVASYASIIPVTHMIRQHLIHIDQVKKSIVGRDEKMDYLYQYMSSAQFKNRVENIVMAFSSLKQDLETEKRSMQRIWAKREKEIERVIMNTSGMYGDVQGIIGASLQTVDVLELSEPTEEEAA